MTFSESVSKSLIPPFIQIKVLLPTRMIKIQSKATQTKKTNSRTKLVPKLRPKPNTIISKHKLNQTNPDPNQMQNKIQNETKTKTKTKTATETETQSKSTKYKSKTKTNTETKTKTKINNETETETKTEMT
jgi:hypothetical protein